VLFDSVPNTGYTADTIWTGLAPEDKPPITTLGIDPGEELSDLKEPLVYVEHDKGVTPPTGIPLRSVTRPNGSTPSSLMDTTISNRCIVGAFDAR